MAVRNAYSLYDERLMWEYIFERLQDGDEAASKPKGLKLWKKFEATQKTNKTASSLATHFRKAMYDHIEEAKIPVEQQLYIASQLDLRLSRRQQKIIEYKENISITTNDFGVVTKYEKEGKEYYPSLLKRRISCENDDINDELGYDAFELNGSVSKIAKFSRNSDNNPISAACSGHYNLRKRMNIENNKLPKIHNLEAAKAMDLVYDNSNCNGNRNEDRNDDDNQNEIIHVRRMSDNKKENGCEQKEICKNAEGSTYEKQLFSNKINGRRIGKSKKMLFVKDELHSDSKESDMNVSKDEIGTVSFRSEILGNQVECVGTIKESGINQRAEVANNIKSLAVKNDQFAMKMISNEILKTTACSNTLTGVLDKGKQEPPTYESIIDDELKQLVSYILNKRQLKGAEKMKVEKILELRAKEAKQFGSDLKSYLRKIQQQMV